MPVVLGVIVIFVVNLVVIIATVVTVDVIFGGGVCGGVAVEVMVGRTFSLPNSTYKLTSPSLFPSTLPPVPCKMQ